MYTGVQTGNIKRAKITKGYKAYTKAYLMIQVPLTLYFSGEFKSICTKCTRIVSHVALAKGFFCASYNILLGII